MLGWSGDRAGEGLVMELGLLRLGFEVRWLTLDFNSCFFRYDVFGEVDEIIHVRTFVLDMR